MKFAYCTNVVAAASPPPHQVERSAAALPEIAYHHEIVAGRGEYRFYPLTAAPNRFRIYAGHTLRCLGDIFAASGYSREMRDEAAHMRSEWSGRYQYTKIQRYVQLFHS